jgi:multidrug efflux pump subunit AcrB
VILRADYGNKVDPAELGGLTVKNKLGLDVPLSELVRVTHTTAPRPILNKDGTRVVLVGGELGNSVPAYAVLDLNHRLNGMPVGNGDRLATGNLGLTPVRADLSRAPVQLLWDGEIRMTLDCYHDLFIALSAAVMLIFFILVAYYRSFILPAAVMSAIPVCFIGLFPGHWLTGQIFSATSLIGLVTLTGVLVRNSLLIADFVTEYMREGISVREAVLLAGAVRLRPILLTSLSIIFGSIIMLIDPIFGGLGCSFIFGTIASTVFTMALTPVMLYWYYTRWPYKEAKDEE